MVRFLRIDPMVSGSSPTSARLSLKSEESGQLSTISGVGITRCGHIDGKDLDTARKAKIFSVSKLLPLTSR